MITSTTPESVGIPSPVLLALVKDLDSLGLPLHSLIVSRHNKIVLESYYAPFDSDTLHRMFSVTKSFTSIAIGQLAFEGHLALSDPVVNYFEDMVPPNVHPFITQMTIEDLLKMTTCHTTTTYKDHPHLSWVESFFTTKPSHKPGTVFNYDTSASHSLGALVNGITGMSVLDYLRKICLNDIHLSQEAYMIQDPFGQAMAGSGLMAKPMDLMVFAQLIMNEGVHGQKSLLSKSYLKVATRKHSDTRLQGSFPETQVGYGYQFWLNRKNGYSCFGMGGQFAICLPEYDLIVVTTADTQGINGGNQLIYNTIYNGLLPHLSDLPLVENPKAYSDLQTLSDQCQLKPVEASNIIPNPFYSNGNSYALDDNQQGFDTITLDIDDLKKKGSLSYQFKSQRHEIPFGIGNLVESQFPIYNQRCFTSGAWLNPNSFYIKSHIIDECLGSVMWHITFHSQGISVYMKKIEESSFNEFEGYLEGKLP